MPQRSVGTGRFIGCYANMIDAEHQVGLEIQRGPSGVLFVRCPRCGMRAFLNGPLFESAGKSIDEFKRTTAYREIVEAPSRAREHSGAPQKVPRGRRGAR